MADRIGVFDSGMGGFSILRKIMTGIPGITVDYISDDAFAPYGVRTDEEITSRSEHITEMLLERGANLIVVACNSATAAAIRHLRETHSHIQFVGVEPYINVLNHLPDIDRAAVITTVLTGKSKKFNSLRNRLDPEHRILHFLMADLATITEEIIEQGYTCELQQKLSREIAPLKEKSISHLILGCTHYPLIADILEKELDVTTIGAAPFVARRVKELLNNPGGPMPSYFSFLSTTRMSWETRTVKQLEYLLRFSGGRKTPWR
ncbi:glutamate racemase [Candidatus Fermentibacteria bacterium]|nr:MAG: glutamate racemase [Candidatus Fermentibacteria bacterium]